MEIKKVSDVRFEIERDEAQGMNGGVTLYTTEAMLEKMKKDSTIQQAINATTLPGLVGNVLVMPDGHQGYGFPVGGVAAFDAEKGIISPGAVGFDINCLHPDTKITLENGEPRRIEELKAGDRVITFDKKRSKSIISNVVLTMKRKHNENVLKVRTRSGKEVVATKDHPLLTKNGMVEAGKIRIGEFVVVKEDQLTGGRPSSDNSIGEGFAFDRITRVTEQVYEGYVYDLTVDNDNHNFLADGVVVSNCGVRLIKTNLEEKDIRAKSKALSDALFRNVPTGVGSKLSLGFTQKDLEHVAEEGVSYVIGKGYGFADEQESIEEHGRLAGADFSKVSADAKKRGLNQLGTLGAGNHFLEVQKVEKIFDEGIAESYGLGANQSVIMVHTGSRGFGHQICSDFLRTLVEYQERHNIHLVDKELSYAHVGSTEADDYIKAMNCAVNFAFTNRQMITHLIRQSFSEVFGKSADALGMELLYDVAHNIAKPEEHTVEGRKRMLYIHRKGATRAFPKGMKEMPKKYRGVGQPVIIPGSMSTGSYVLCGMEGSMRESFGSACHGSGRVMSRHEAIRTIPAEKTFRSLRDKGIEIRVRTRKLISEEAEWAYKNPDEVVGVVEKAGLAKIVSRNIPMVVIKG